MNEKFKPNPCLAIPRPLVIEEVLPEGIITWRRFIGPKFLFAPTQAPN
jgi:hypothetical protein